MNKYTAHLDCVRMDGLHLLECNGPNTLADQRVLAERIAALLNADEQHKADEEYKRPYLQQPVTLTCHQCGTVLAGPGVHDTQDAAANMPYMRQCDRCYQTFDTAKGHDCKEKPITDDPTDRQATGGCRMKRYALTYVQTVTDTERQKMTPSDDGEWVRYEDAANIRKAALEEAAVRLEELRGVNFHRAAAAVRRLIDKETGA